MKRRLSNMKVVLAATLAGAWAMVAMTPTAYATSAFARATGAECSKCHSGNFPRLNVKGERFMRNGFQLRKSADDLEMPGFDDEPKVASYDRKVADDLFLNRLSDLMALAAKINVYSKNSEKDRQTIGKPEFMELYATGTIAPDVPIWAEVEFEDGEAKLEDYWVGMTNLNGSTLANVRVGAIDPTTWTSFSNRAGSINSAHGKIGAYRGSDNFTAVGANLGRKESIEYYGYTDQFLWAAALATPPAETTPSGDEESDLDYWLVGRWDIMGKHSVSVLYYDSNGTPDASVISLAGNVRVGKKLDLLAQYSMDDSGSGAVDDVSGYTLQGDYMINDHWIGVVRYDTTDNGAASDADETQLTAEVLFKPYQNIKLAAAFIKELDRAGGGAKEDMTNVQLELMF